jgi:hypothetical protein
MRAIGLVAVMAVAGGCMDTSIEVAPTWDAAQSPQDVATWTGEVRAAIDAWQTAVGPHCHFPVVIDSQGTPIALSDPAKWPRVAAGFDGHIEPDGSIMVLGDRATGHRDVIAHELGRLIGLHDRKEIGSIMQPMASSAFMLPSARDGATARQALGCYGQ